MGEGHCRSHPTLSVFLNVVPENGINRWRWPTSLTSTCTRTPVDSVNHRFWLSSSGVWPEESAPLRSFQVTPRLLVGEPHFHQQGLSHSPERGPSHDSLCPACLWVPHNASSLRRMNKAPLHSTPDFFFSLYLICCLPGPSLRCLLSHGPALSKLWDMECKVSFTFTSEGSDFYISSSKEKKEL